MEATNKWELWKKKYNVTPFDLLNPNIQKVDNEMFNNRFELCKVCPEFIKLTTQCKQCGCIMKAKATIEKATCPLGKW